MRRLALLVCVLFTLTGCSSFMSRNNITNLLSAPKFSQTENEIVNAIDSYIGEDISLRYSTSHGYSSPIQLIDIDDDQTEEAVVFYYAPNKGANIRIALLANTKDDWQIVFDKEGLGTDVFFFATEKFGRLSGKQLLVGYETTGMDENFFATYFTDTDKNIEDYVERCQSIVVGDVNYDGSSDIILSNNTADGRIRLRSFEFGEDNKFRLVGTRLLKYHNITPTQFTLAKSSYGETVLYADYRDEYNQMHTEAMLFHDGGKMFDAFENTVVTRPWEYSMDLNSTDIDGDGVVETPTVVQKQRGEDPEVLKMVQWTDYTRKQPRLVYTGVFDTQEGLFVALPENWTENIETFYGGSYWQITAKVAEEAETEEDTDESEETEETVAPQPLLTVKQLDSYDKAESGAYSYVVYKDTKIWHFQFSNEVELSEIQYIITRITDLG